jgi:hypothetical protein
MDNATSISASDRTILRELAKRVKDIASLPIQRERIAMWTDHNSLRPRRPMVLVFPEGGWRELLPDSALTCQDKFARNVEAELRRRIHTHEHFVTDAVIEDTWLVGPVIRDSGWGLQAKWHFSDDPTGARAFDPVIREPADLKKLRFPELTCDERATSETYARVHDLLGDVLDVRRCKLKRVCYHLMAQYTSWRGLEQVMIDMIENPSWLHDAMALLTEGHKLCLKQLVDMNLLDTNHDNSYNNSGGNGWTDDLPASGFDPSRVRPRDVWSFAESQELAQVSPEMHEEFALRYEKQLLEPFGLTGYGCCEDLTRKLDYVLKIPRIRRISISPWADVEKCAAKLGRKAIFSWKPHPGMIAGDYSPTRIREYIRKAVAAARGCVFEMILKDTHTCDNRPERFDTWSRIAMEEACA